MTYILLASLKFYVTFAHDAFPAVHLGKAVN